MAEKEIKINVMAPDAYDGPWFLGDRFFANSEDLIDHFCLYEELPLDFSKVCASDPVYLSPLDIDTWQDEICEGTDTADLEELIAEFNEKLKPLQECPTFYWANPKVSPNQAWIDYWTQEIQKGRGDKKE